MKIGKIILFLVISSIFSLFGRESRDTKYFIAIKKNEKDALKTLSYYQALNPPEGRFYADPMLFKYNGLNYIFFEDYDYNKGVISYVAVGEDLSFSKPEKVLELPIHLSFPFVFQEGEDIYMVPETYDYKSVLLFKAVEFPSKWTFERVLVEGDNFSDPIIFKYEGYYWLFIAVQMNQLRIYFASDLYSKFKEHPINQKKLRGRNAGGIYMRDHVHIRPVMNCERGYGKSVILKEILLLTTEEYKEKTIRHLLPNWALGLSGMHTYCENEDLVVYDGRFVQVKKDI